MENILTKLIIAAILIVLTLVSGFWLHQNGRPLQAALFNIHKLLSLAFVVFLVLIFLYFNQQLTISGTRMMLVLSAGFFLLIVLVSGGFLSFEKPFNFLFLSFHRIASLLFLISGSYLFFVFLKELANS